MEDNNYLRMIANPYLLKKDNINDNNLFKQENIIKTNHFLYLYIEKKYPLKYIPPNIFYEIIEIIDNKILEHDIKEIVTDIIQSVIIKFDKDIITDNTHVNTSDNIDVYK